MKTPHASSPSHPDAASGRRPGQGRRRGAGARRVLQWLAQGHDLAAIAQRLGRDAAQLQARLDALFARLGVGSALAALDKLKGQHPADAPAAADDAVAALDDMAADDDDHDDEGPAAESAQAAAGTTTE